MRARRFHQAAVQELSGLVEELSHGAPGTTTPLMSTGRVHRLGGYVAAGLLELSECEAAAQEIPRRDRRRRFLSAVRDGARGRPCRPWLGGKQTLQAPVRRHSRALVSKELPGEQLLSLLGGPAVGRVSEDPELSSWLRSERCIPPELVEERWLALALRGEPDGLSWCDYWYAAGYRLLVPLWDPRGRLKSVRARYVGSGKAVAPTTFSVRGLVMADCTGRRLLEDGPAGARRTVIVAEGEPDFLTWAAVVDHESPEVVMPSDFAVLGVFSGSWTRELAERIPSGSRLAVRTHNDPAGDHFASVIEDTLAGRCELRRKTGER